MIVLFLFGCKEDNVSLKEDNAIKFTLEFSAETGGSVSSPGGLYSLGETVTITATPDSDYFFSGWSDGTSTSSLTILVSSDQTITASFSLIDVILPAITLVGSPTIELTIGNTFTDPGATATDNIDGDLTSSITTSGSVDTSSTGSYMISYSISDATGNSASVTRTVVIVEDYIELNIRIHLMQSEAWIHPLVSEMNMWVTESDVRQTIIPEMNLIWSQASIEWKVEGIINEPIVEYTGFEEDVEYIINSKRDDQGRSDKARLPLLYNLMNPSYLSSEIELEKNLFHIYIFPFIGNTSQGNAMRPFGFHSVVGCWTNKHNGGGNPQKTLLTEPHSEIDRGSLARTISHELGHVLGLSHSCNNCLMYSKGYELNTSQIIISTEEAIRRGGM